MKWSALHALFLAPILLVAVVCEDESAPQAVPTTATRTVTPVGLAPTISTRPADGDFGPDDPAYALDQRSGIGPVDAAIAAILSGDSDAVRKLLIPLSLKCSLEPSGGFPQPPKCLPGMSDGSIVEAFPVGGPEGSYVLAANAATAFRSLLDSKPRLFAVYNVTTNNEPGWPSGKYGVVFVGSGQVRGVLLSVSADGIVNIAYGGGRTNPYDFTNRVTRADFILPPLK